MVTSIDAIKKYAEGSEVELSGFVDGENITVKLRRPSILGMAQSGKIPNPLLSAAAGLFKDGVSKSVQDGGSLKTTGDLLMCIARDALVSPTMEQLEDAGIALTDIQLVEIYNWTQTGVDAVARFRKRQKSLASSGNLPGEPSQPNNGD